MQGDPTHAADGLVEQQEQVVHQYALRLREAAALDRPGADGNGRTRRAYELLNECAMELARLTRQEHAAPEDVDWTRH
jgi:hypothetical protein